MNRSTHPFEEIGQTSRILDPCILVIFGATGDLTARKLMPAIYNLKREGQLPTHFVCCGFARREKTHDVFRSEMKEATYSHSRFKPIEESMWASFRNQLFYHQSEFDQDEGYSRLDTFLKELDIRFGTKGNRIYYLSTQPSYFTTITEKLKKHQLLYDHNKKENYSRVIIEKPFGHDYDSALRLQKDLMQHLSESQLYRIDHYLGKETVQNLIVFRYGNSIFENLWNHRYIDHVQLTVAEEIGIGTRGHFYEEQGLVRDIMQNHMMQLLSLIAMEPPVSLSPKAIHDEKVKVLQAIRPYKKEDEFKSWAIRGQYDQGYISGEEVKAYREEENVSRHSNVETYAALKLYIDNWRWDGVPFYLRGAKRLPKRATEIAIAFKHPPGILFKEQGQRHEPNVLAIRIQPNEGISLKINCKVPGPSSPIQPVKMDFRYGSFFGLTPPDAYERLICDCIAGDNTLFARQDEVFYSWEFFTPLLKYWAENIPEDFPNYPCGSWGPSSAEKMIGRDGRKWRLI